MTDSTPLPAWVDACHCGRTFAQCEADPCDRRAQDYHAESPKLDDLFRCYCGARVVLCHTRQGDLYWTHSQWSGDPDHEIGLTAATVRYEAGYADND